MNKKVKGSWLILVASIFFFLGASAQVSNQEIANVYQKALELNQGRFADPNLIFIGDTVLFPAKSGPGIEAWIADKPSEGKHDSFWRLSEKYLLGQLATVPADTMKVVIKETKAEEVVTTDKDRSWLIWLLLSILFAATLIFLILLLRSRRRYINNPDNYQPVGGNIDVMPRAETLNSVMSRYLQPGERLISFRRGTLANGLRQRRFSTEMEFGDNVRRTVWLNAGERVSTAVIEDRNGNRRTQHLRNACSNGFGGGSFQLPTGWFIQYDETEEAGRVETEDDGNGGQRLVSPANTSDPIPSTPASFQGNMDNLVKIIQGVSLDKDSNLKISFKENKDGINLSIKIKRTE